MIKKTKDFIPRKIGNFINFIRHFIAVFPTYATILGFTLEEVTTVTTQATECETDLNDQVAKQNAAQAATTKLNETKKLLTATIRAYAARAKTSPKYTEDMGQDIDIIGEEIIIDPDTMKPELEVLIVGDMPTIKWKKSYSEGVNIYSMRGNETDFTFLARDTVSPYHDTRPNLEPGKPETRKYYAFYVYDDEQIGLQSDTKNLTVRA